VVVLSSPAQRDDAKKRGPIAVKGPGRRVLESVQIFLAGLIDYAGLFPPAELDMESAVRNYASYRSGDYAWALGRFIAPIDRLEEFERSAQDFLPSSSGTGPWRVSVLCSPNVEVDVRKILDFNRRHSKSADIVIDALEINIRETDEIGPVRGLVSDGIVVYFEVPVVTDPREIAKIGNARGRAKVRTGGTRAELVPATTDLVRFIKACADAGLPFKATAGLHHAVRSVQKFTYHRDSASGIMHGFLNLFVAAIFIRAGLSCESAAMLMEEQSRTAFRFGPEGIFWRNHQIRNEQLRDGRNFAIAFGSCSFEEPIDDLKTLGLL
jgi:hypothetical protein